MTNKDLANLIFPNINESIEDIKAKYPDRCLLDTQYVTRFAPSPTGFMHIGNFMQCLIDYLLSKNSNGVFFLRIEDTDKKREVTEAVEAIFNAIHHYQINPDEYEYNGTTVGNYGPYFQSERKEIYHAFVKHLIEIGRAYPCFCTATDLEVQRENQEKIKIRPGYYGNYAKCRNIPVEEAMKKIQNGESFLVRFKSMGDFNKKFVFDDQVKGKLELPENDQDIVIMKSDNGLPTYHFAHLVDDYLMQTTHVIRGEEWLSSVPTHIELFNAFGFKTPKYIHTPLIMKKDGDIVRKISKRKDPEASMSYFEEKGYPYLAIIESLLTIINSNFEEWRTSNPDSLYTEFKFNPKKMSSSGAFYDLDKLDNISKNIISKMSAIGVYNGLNDWSIKYDESFNKLISQYKEYTIDILNIERVQNKPRKDYANYSSVKGLIWYMYDELFSTYDKYYEYQKINDREEIKRILNTYVSKYYDANDDKDTWFNKIKQLCDELGYASDMKLYKENPDNFKGNVADISMVIRVSLTTKTMTPDLYEIMKLMGEKRIFERLNSIK